jgi:hypothetical protein
MFLEENNKAWAIRFQSGERIQANSTWTENSIYRNVIEVELSWKRAHTKEKKKKKKEWRRQYPRKPFLSLKIHA